MRKTQRQGVTTAHNKRLQGKIMRQYKIMELSHNFDPNCLTCPSAAAFFVSCPNGTAQKMSRLNFWYLTSAHVQPAASALQATSCNLPVVRNGYAQDRKAKDRKTVYAERQRHASCRAESGKQSDA
jgi:hypothetical protein